MNKKKVFMLLIFGVLLMSSIGLTKIKCEEKQKSESGEKYLECEGGSTIEQVYGTEYVQGQNGTIFIQVLNNDGEVFNDTLLCQLEVWLPNKTKIINTIMNDLGEDGLYYYDINPVFNNTGVYMLSSTCYYPVSENQSTEFFRTNATYDYFISTDQGDSNAVMTITSDENSFTCEPMTYFVEQEPYDKFFYIDNITATTYWDKSPPTVNMDLAIRIYRQDIYTLDTELIRSQIIYEIPISNVISEVNFSIPIRTFIDTNEEKLVIDLCSRRSSGVGSITINFNYNGNTTGYNSSITKYAIEKNVSLGYQEIKGSGEIHISAREIFLGSQENQNMMWIIIIGIVAFFVIMGLWYGIK